MLSAPIFYPMNQAMPIPAAPPAPAPSHAGPKSLADLFLSFTRLALQGFGGVLPIVQQELVEKKQWLTREEFIEDWAVAQLMPGPNVVNISLMIGARHFGLRGALAALAGMLLAPLLLLLCLALAYAHVASSPGVAGALRGMGAVTAGLVAATGLKLGSALKTNVLGLWPCLGLAVGCFIAIALLHWPLLHVLGSGGLLAGALAYRKLG
jgi:chromate transporter